MQKEILLAFFPKITNSRYRQLIKFFSSLGMAWQTEFDELKKIGWEDNLINEFLTWREQLEENKIQEILDKEKINCLTISDPDYPALLKEIYDPPFCLFVKGNLKKCSPALAVVGSRKFTLYGKQITNQIVGELSKTGINIVSGLALGIDSLAHEATLDNQGRTIAVLGSGIDENHIYPTIHRQLSQRIISNGGAVISEYRPGSEPTKYTFPERNRIIAGISLGVLVIEAGEKSGSLITAQCALDNNREVFAIPQNINSLTSFGTNDLLKKGAKVVTEAMDILEALNLQEISNYVNNKEIKPESETEAKLLEFLSREPIQIEELIKKSGLSSQTVNSALVLMEIKNKIKNLGGMRFITN